MISAHFAVHHLAAAEAPVAEAKQQSVARKLSTGLVDQPVHNVDDSPARAPSEWLLGLVVPKRHARRAVTRSVLKREMRAAFRRGVSGLEPGEWLMRLRSPFDPKAFPSAASRPLMLVARGELDDLLERCLSSSAGPR